MKDKGTANWRRRGWKEKKGKGGGELAKGRRFGGNEVYGLL